MGVTPCASSSAPVTRTRRRYPGPVMAYGKRKPFDGVALDAGIFFDRRRLIDRVFHQVISATKGRTPQGVRKHVVFTGEIPMKQLQQTQLSQVVGGQVAIAAAVAAAENAGASRAEVVATVGGLGGGFGASVAIEAAGSLAAMGTTAIAAATAGALGLYAAWEAGKAIGGAVYENSETVQNLAQGAVGLGFKVASAASDFSQGIGEHSCTYGPGHIFALEEDAPEEP